MTYVGGPSTKSLFLKQKLTSYAHSLARKRTYIYTLFLAYSQEENWLLTYDF